MIDLLVDEGIDPTELPDQALLQAAADAACSAAGLKKSAIFCLRFADDDAVCTLNKQWLSDDKVTDVLSFPMQDGPDYNLDESVGDIILAWPYVKREAARLELAPHQHAFHLVIHGILHLFGYDHLKNDETKRMRSAEQRALRALDLHDPYAEK